MNSWGPCEPYMKPIHAVEMRPEGGDTIKSIYLLDYSQVSCPSSPMRRHMIGIRS